MKKFLICFFLIIFSKSLCGQDYFKTTKLIDNGPDENRVVFAIMGDGYTAAQIPQYRTEIKDIVDRMMSEEPLVAYRSFINVYMIEVISNESGVDEVDKGIYKDTYLNSGFKHSIQRLMTTDGNKAKATAALNVPHYDQAVVIGNTTRYGGSGGSVAVSYNGGSAAIMNIHEIGHSLFKLADEYDYGHTSVITTEPSQRNVTIQTNRSLIKWNKWIKSSTPIPTPETSDYDGAVGLFEGAKYRKEGVFRPKRKCIMNSMWNNVFCEVCREAHIRVFHEHVTKIESTSGDISSLEQGALHNFSVNLVHPSSHKLSVSWYLDGAKVGTGDNLTLDTAGVSIGNHTLKAIVQDKTLWVKYTTDKFREEKSWSFSVTKPNSIPKITALTATPQTIGVYETTQLKVTATDADGDNLTYNWKVISAPGIYELGKSGNTANMLVSVAGIYTVRAIVSDGKDTVKKTIDITVEDNSVLITDSGTLSLDQSNRNSWRTVSLNNTYTDPVIIFSPLTNNGGDPVTVRVKNVSSDSFDWQIQEWDYRGNGYHVTEQFSYIVLEAGTYGLSNGRQLIAGNVNSSDSFTKKYFAKEFQSENPIIVTQIVSATDATAAAVRVKNVLFDSFEIKLQSQESFNKVHGDERVSFIAIDPGSYDELGIHYAGSTGKAVTHEFFKFSFEKAYSKLPKIMASMQSTNGNDTATVRFRNPSKSGVEVKIEEEQSKDDEVNHTKENVGFILFETE